MAESFNPSDSILKSVKKLVGLPEDYEVFNPDLIYYINGYLNVLNQLGVGQNGFGITGENETWSEFLGTDAAKLSMALPYVAMRVKRVFDPPANSSVSQALKEEADELGWRMNVEVDPGGEFNEIY